MSFSLNEIESMSKKAARGAGLSWGMAEEAGKATRWLTSHGLAGGELLADLLVQNDQLAHDQVAPVSVDGVWQGCAGPLCPLVCGAALNDCAGSKLALQPVEMAGISHPLLVVPFAAWAAIHIKSPVSVSWKSARIETDGFGIWLEDPEGEIAVTSPVSLTCRRAEPRDDRAAAPSVRGDVSAQAWQKLGEFAHRTYARATEESRMRGAGAGTTDND